MLAPSDKVVEALEQIRKNCDQPFPSIADWDHLIALLQTIFCEHDFEKKRMGGPPDMAESLEVIEECKKCGMWR